MIEDENNFPDSPEQDPEEISMKTLLQVCPSPLPAAVEPRSVMCLPNLNSQNFLIVYLLSDLSLKEPLGPT